MNSLLTSENPKTFLANRGLERLNPLEISGWDDLVSARDDTNIFYTAGWARVLHESYGFTPFYLVRMDQARIQTLLPLMEVGSWLTRTRGVSLPFTDECAPLSDASSSMSDILREARTLGDQRKWRYLEIHGGHGFSDPPSPSIQFYKHILDLGVSSSELWKRLDSSVRRAIRKAEQSGVSFEVSNTNEAMDRFVQLNALTRKKHGLPPQPATFFRAVHRNVIRPGLGWIAECRLEHQVVAAGIFFFFGRQAIYKYGASNPLGQEVRANNLFMWEAIKRLHAEGCRNLHFGRSSRGQEGLRRYKRQFGAEEMVLDYYKYDLRKGAFVTESDRAFGWYNRVFSRLPMALSRLIGRLAYRHTA